MAPPEDMGSRLNMTLALKTKVPERSRHSMVSLGTRLKKEELISIEVRINFEKDRFNFKNIID
jgi:hypothetical protein